MLPTQRHGTNRKRSNKMVFSVLFDFSWSTQHSTIKRVLYTLHAAVLQSAVSFGLMVKRHSPKLLEGMNDRSGIRQLWNAGVSDRRYS